MLKNCRETPRLRTRVACVLLTEYTTKGIKAIFENCKAKTEFEN